MSEFVYLVLSEESLAGCKIKHTLLFCLTVKVETGEASEAK